MIGRYIRGRVSVSIDAGNIWYAQKTLGWRIDYTKLKTYLATKCDLRDIRFYTGIFYHDPQQRKFLQKLQQLDYKLVTKEVKKIETDPGKFSWKSNLDIELALDAMEHRNSFDTFILFSGDSDFAPLIDRLHSYGKNTIIFSTRNHVSKELAQRGKYIDLKRLTQYIAL